MHFQAMTEGITGWIAVLDHRRQQHSTLEPPKSTGETAQGEIKNYFPIAQAYSNT